MQTGFDGVALIPHSSRSASSAARPGAPDLERWQLHQADVDELAWYCPDRAEREFGDD
jgi:hypothetical protein